MSDEIDLSEMEFIVWPKGKISGKQYLKSFLKEMLDVPDKTQEITRTIAFLQKEIDEYDFFCTPKKQELTRKSSSKDGDYGA